jgi:hypothetical protein
MTYLPPPNGYVVPKPQYGSPYGSFTPGAVGNLRVFLPGDFVGIPPAPNPAFWLDGRVVGYSDAAHGNAASPPLGRVISEPQGGRLPGNFSTTTLSVSPQRKTPGSLFFYSDSKLTAPVLSPAISLPAQSCTIGWAFSPWDPNGGGRDDTIMMGLAPDTNDFGVYLTNNGGLFIDCGNGSTINLLGLGFAKALSQVVAVVRFTATTVNYKVLINGVVTEGTVANAQPAVNISNFAFGAANTNPFVSFTECYGTLSQGIGYARVLSDNERDAVFNSFVALPAAGLDNGSFVDCEGDSIMRDIFVNPRQLQTTFSALQNLLPTFPTLQMMVTAKSGDTIALMSGRYPTQVKPLFSSQRRHNVLVVSCGTNDFAAAGGSANGITTKNALWAYCDQAKADGFIVIPGTMLPREGMSVAFEPARTVFNNAVRAEWAGKGYAALYDEAAVAGMGAFGDSANLTNYQDGTHPTAVGCGLLRPQFQAAVTTALSLP